MKFTHSGFSLLELLVGLSITLVVAAGAFAALRNSNRAFNDQNLITAMQQNTRAIATQIEDELRMAGQNSPAYDGRFDTAPLEACQTILNGSSSSQLVFRSGISNITSRATTPLSYAIDTPTVVNIADVSAFASAIGGAAGRFVYVYGKTPTLWGWVRAQVTAIDTGANTVNITPTQSGTTGTVFTSPMAISLEEAFSYRLNGNSLLRGTVANFTNLTAPVMTETTMGNDFTSLQFNYYDAAGNSITPDTLANRAQVRQVDVSVIGRTSRVLSNGTRPTFAITVRALPRNLGLK